MMVLVDLGRVGGDYVWDGEQWQWLEDTEDESLVRVRYGDDEDKLDGKEESSIPDPVEGNVTASLLDQKSYIGPYQRNLGVNMKKITLVNPYPPLVGGG